ncbi:hypothetical protein QFC21_001517 [Naganishia friedmannii]|uniref:Uncharacterized protein n=1 Tax=Naganishia friedmannii TaxID=89922 RepID=A0ACC2W4M5_9TREE|nr:hypothetical protein QFC21_001517 [Naganishia friedmannii]
MIQVDMAAYGAGLSSATNTSVGGLYDTKADDKLGTKLGLRQTYRWNYLGACAYVTSGDGICNSTSFGHAFVPLAAILSDTPAKFTNQTTDIIPTSTFKNNSYNKSLSRVAFWTAFVRIHIFCFPPDPCAETMTGFAVYNQIGACAALVAFIAGVIPNRVTFLVAALATIISAVGLCIGAAIWTVLIDKNDFLNIVKVQGGKSLGIHVTAGPALLLEGPSVLAQGIALLASGNRL